MSNRYRNMFGLIKKNVPEPQNRPKTTSSIDKFTKAEIEASNKKLLEGVDKPDIEESMSSKYAKAAFKTIREEYIKEKENEDLLLEGYERNQMQRDIYNRLVANIYDYINIDFSQHCKESFLKASIATSIYFQKENA